MRRFVAYATSSVHTVKLSSVFGPKVCVIGTSAASRPIAISTRPMRGILLRASKVYQRPPRYASNQPAKSPSSHVPGRTDRGLKTPRRDVERRCRVPLFPGDPGNKPRLLPRCAFRRSASPHCSTGELQQTSDASRAARMQRFGCLKSVNRIKAHTSCGASSLTPPRRSTP